MIVREISQYRVLDATTTTLTDRPLDYRPILAPLLDWVLGIVERRIVVLEPKSGTLGSPEPNAFMVVVPSSFSVGQIFGIQLLDTDWESEGFAVGDELAMAMGPLTANSIFLRATIQGISGQVATFRISFAPTILGTLNTQNPFPLVAFLVNERFDIRYALLRAGDVGFVSPLNGQPFYIAGHANHIELSSYSVTTSTSQYNLLLYDASQEVALDLYLPNARNLKFVTIEIRGTQFYAYRTSLNPTANSPTQAYPTRGRIVIDAKAPNELRNMSFETECLLLHPNRIEETNSFVSSGTLSIVGGSASISAPSIPSPVKQRVCLLGQDSHHSLPSVLSSYDLTSPTTPPATPPPRSGADYVGVVVGQVGGRWVAAMTNKVLSASPTYDLEIINEGLNPARYDCIVLKSSNPSARQTGTYTVVIYGKIAGVFVPLASYDLNIAGPVATPLPDFPDGVEALGNLFPFEREILNPYGIRLANYDAVFTSGKAFLGDSSLFFVPIPSGAEPPPLGTLATPASGYLLDLWSFLDTPKVIKAQLICPDGTLLESGPKEMPEPRPDIQLATVTQDANLINVTLDIFRPSSGVGEIQLRVALFPWPAGHSPMDQAMYFAVENYTTNTVVTQREKQGNRVRIDRKPLSGYAYLAVIDITGLPPGQYAVHVRSEFVHPMTTRYESFFYTLAAGIPVEPSAEPPPQTRCKVETPAIYGEPWPYIVIRELEVEKHREPLTRCKLDDYCSCFVFVPEIPENWVDIVGTFEGAIMGIPIPTGGFPAQHKVRLMGRIIRIDDEYETESFVSSVYKEEDIVRAY